MAGVKSGVRKKELTLKVALKIQEMRRISFAIGKVVVLHPSLDIVNEPVRPLLFTISSRSLYQGKVFL